MNAATMAREKREVAVSFALSLILHLLLLLLFAALLSTGFAPSPTPLADEDDELEITILPPPADAAPPTPRFVDTGATPEVAEAPEGAVFESDKSTRAASNAPATDTGPLPSQEGRESEFLELDNRRFTPGTLPAPATPSPPAETLPEASAIPAATPPPEPQPTPKQEEPAREIVRPPRADELAIGRPNRVLPAAPTIPENVRQEVRRAEAARPVTPSDAGFQPERRATRIVGGVSNRGDSAVDAMGTPLGRYKKALSDAIGSRWYFYVSDRIDLLAVGTLTIRFAVSQAGKVSGIQVLRNSSNESFASVSIRSIVEADIPPIPPEVAEHLDSGSIEVDYTFSILPN